MKNLSGKSNDVDLEEHEKRQEKCLRNMNKLNRVIVRLNLFSLENRNYRSDLQAAAILCLSRKLVGVEPHWSKEMESLTKFKEAELMRPIQYILSNFKMINLGGVQQDASNVFPLLSKLPYTVDDELMIVSKAQTCDSPGLSSKSIITIGTFSPAGNRGKGSKFFANSPAHVGGSSSLVPSLVTTPKGMQTPNSMFKPKPQQDSFAGMVSPHPS